ncbi:hypothetical protein B0T13DRAFT_311409 [Neurospora crassa]|nr:hypothetical protein B0T13DRAFT_311409 [Neurospora crassa]
MSNIRFFPCLSFPPIECFFFPFPAVFSLRVFIPSLFPFFPFFFPSSLRFPFFFYVHSSFFVSIWWGEGLKRKKLHFSSFSSKPSEERKIAGRQADRHSRGVRRERSQSVEGLDEAEQKKKKKEGLLHIFHPAV